MMNDENYFAFLVRFSRREGHSGWQAILENVHTHEKRQFSTEIDLMVFLMHALEGEGEFSSSAGKVYSKEPD